jgi:hypothetical protein
MARPLNVDSRALYGLAFGGTLTKIVSPVPLCPSFSNARNHEGARVAGIATRAALTRSAAA